MWDNLRLIASKSNKLPKPYYRGCRQGRILPPAFGWHRLSPRSVRVNAQIGRKRHGSLKTHRPHLARWRNGALAGSAGSVLTHTFHYGLGVFEGVRAYKTPEGTSIFRLKEHTDRLYRSAHILRMDMPYDKETLNAAQREVVRANELDEAYIRPMCFLGSEGMGLRADNLKTHVMVASWAWPSYMDPEARDRGIRIATSSYTRHHVNITMCKAKANGNYINSILALREAMDCLLYTSPSPRDLSTSRMPSSA